MKKLRIILAVLQILLAILLGLLAYCFLKHPEEPAGIPTPFIAQVPKEQESTKTESIPEIYEQRKDDLALLLKYQEYNSDVVGLIRIEGTVLNHPIVQTPSDEDYYLYKDLDKKYNSHGVPFLSANSLMEGQGGNRILYGHNIHKRTKDVFAELSGYEELSFYQKHPIIETVSKSGTRRWLIVAYFLVDNADEEPFRYSDVTTFLSKQDFDSYFEEVSIRNWLDVPMELSIDDTFLTLSSCSNELAGSGTNRMVVISKQLNKDDDVSSIVASTTMKESPLLPKRLQ